MKRFIGVLFFVLFAVGIGTAKDFPKDSLCYGTPGDSVSEMKFNSLYKYTYATYEDSGSVITLGGLRDSVVFEAYDNGTGQWYPVAIYDITADTVANASGYFAATTGTTRKYLINEVRPYLVRARLVNYRAEFPARKGYISWSGEND